VLAKSATAKSVQAIAPKIQSLALVGPVVTWDDPAHQT
jgi:hypothetical protein